MKTAVKKTTPPAPIPTTVGAPFAGGYYAGRFFDAGQAYALIAAPKDTGEQAKIAWSATDKTVKGALSYSDGPANTAAMAKAQAGSALAQWVRGLKIGGHPDWFRSARDQCACAGVPFFFKQWGEHLPICTLDEFKRDQKEPSKITRGWLFHPDADYVFERVGKKAAGRLLDGVSHSEYPA